MNWLSSLLHPRKWLLKRRFLSRASELIGFKPKWWWSNKKIRIKTQRYLSQSTNPSTWLDIKNIILSVPGIKDVALQGEFTPTDQAKLYIKFGYRANFEEVFNSVKGVLKEKAPLDFYIGVKILPWTERINPKLDY